MTLTERATGEWLDRKLTGLKGDALLQRLAELAPEVSLSAERAAGIFRRYRYEMRFAARHYEVSRKFGVCESSYDPGAMSDMMNAETFQSLMGYGASGSNGEESSPAGSKAAALAEAAAVLLEYLRPGMLKLKARWVWWRQRRMARGEKVMLHDGGGSMMVRGVELTWILCAVIIVKNGEVIECFPETKIRRSNKLKSGRSMQFERLDISGEQLNREELCHRFAAMLRLYKGAGSGLRSQVHLAVAADVTKQAVNDMELRMKQHYHRQTGGRAQFEMVTGKGPQRRANKKTG